MTQSPEMDTGDPWFRGLKKLFYHAACGLHRSESSDPSFEGRNAEERMSDKTVCAFEVSEIHPEGRIFLHDLSWQ